MQLNNTIIASCISCLACPTCHRLLHCQCLLQIWLRWQLDWLGSTRLGFELSRLTFSTRFFCSVFCLFLLYCLCLLCMRHMLHKCCNSRGSSDGGIKWKINFANTHKTDMQIDRERRTDSQGQQRELVQREQRTNLPHATCYTMQQCLKKVQHSIWFLLHVVTLARLMTVFGVNIFCFGRNCKTLFTNGKTLSMLQHVAVNFSPKTFPAALICTLSITN